MPVEAYEYRIQEIRRRIKELDSVMTDDVNKFEKILQEQVRLTIEGEALLIVKKVISEVFVRIVMRTPVDTGRARASWQFGVGTAPSGVAPDKEYLELKDKEISEPQVRAAVASALEEISVAPASVWFISNNLEYIEALEAGWSKKQAPAGMVSLTLREMTRQLEQELGKA